MQVAIVTGASSGIGLGCATRLAGTGMAVLGTGATQSGWPSWKPRSATPTGSPPSRST